MSTFLGFLFARENFFAKFAVKCNPRSGYNNFAKQRTSPLSYAWLTKELNPESVYTQKYEQEILHQKTSYKTQHYILTLQDPPCFNKAICVYKCRQSSLEIDLCIYFDQKTLMFGKSLKKINMILKQLVSRFIQYVNTVFFARYCQFCLKEICFAQMLLLTLLIAQDSRYV